MKVGQTEAGQSSRRPSGVERLARGLCLRPETAAGRNAQVLLNSVGTGCFLKLKVIVSKT